MRNPLLPISTFLTLSLFCTFSLAQQEPTRSRTDPNWTHYLVPLPKQITIIDAIEVPKTSVEVIALNEDLPLSKQAAKELKESLGQIPDATISKDEFTITLEHGGAEAKPLYELPNADQSYRIIPNEKKPGVRLIALTSRGLYYAAKTMQQLIRVKQTESQVQMPILEVTDWPDIKDRGLWGTDAYYHIQWLSDRKMNYMEQTSSGKIDKDKLTSIGLREDNRKRKMIEEGPTYGINPVPAIPHMERAKSWGLFEAYPELEGKGDCHEGVICYSNPVFIDVLADWLAEYGEMPEVSEVDVWLSENLQGKKGCQCPKCAGQNRDLLEARAVVAAWEKARERVPCLGLRILTSEETAASNDLIFKQLPPNVKVWYYHSLISYYVGHFEIIPREVAEAAARGQEMGTCFLVSTHWRLFHPFTSAPFMQYRMKEIVDKKLKGWLGYPTPRVHYNAFNVEAGAEWSWNANGRSPKEFALSWAFRRGLDNPELFAEWSETIGPVSWDIYGSEWPCGERRNSIDRVAKQLREGTLPELGAVRGIARFPWGDIRSVEHLDKDAQQAQRALEIAREMGTKEFIEESLVIEGYAKSLQALWNLKQLVTTSGLAEKNRQAAQRYFRAYTNGLKQVGTALPEWETAILKMPYDRGGLVNGSIEIIDRAIDEMSELAKELGCEIK